MQRTIANRIWKQLMGRGIVHPVDAMGTAPWNEDLLDYLAGFLVEHEYDLKKLLAEIAKSRTYQLQAERVNEGGEEYVFRGPVMKPLTAEQFLDGIRAVTGTWPAPDQKALKGAGRAQGGQLTAVLQAHSLKEWDGRPLRAAFTLLDPLQAALGRPNRAQVVSSRPELVTTLEAITLANGPRLASLLDEAAKSLAPSAASSPDALLEGLYLAALCRVPTADERRIAQGLMGDPVTAEGLSDALWTLFMLPEFHYVQ